MGTLLDILRKNPLESEILFCIESSGGKRTSWGYGRRKDLLRYIDGLAPKNRTIYEVIPAGRSCKLFLDLDLKRIEGMNPSFPTNLVSYGVHVVARVKQLISRVEPTFEEKLNNVVIKTSHSVGEKFSMHLVFPDLVFEDINNVGAFVRKLMTEVGLGIKSFEEKIKAGEAPPDPLLYLVNEDPECIIDAGVYSFNQNLRLLYCTKFGEERPFNTVVGDHEDTFIASCVGGFPSSGLLTWDETDGSEAINTKSTFVTLKKNVEKLGPFGHGDTVKNKVKNAILSKTGVEVIGYEYIENENGEGYIVIKTNSKFCTIADKEHASNKVYYVLNCQSMVMYQKCHDTECKNMRGEEKLLI